jgi:hypothetical protein
MWGEGKVKGTWDTHSGDRDSKGTDIRRGEVLRRFATSKPGARSPEVLSLCYATCFEFIIFLRNYILTNIQFLSYVLIGFEMTSYVILFCLF